MPIMKLQSQPEQRCKKPTILGKGAKILRESERKKKKKTQEGYEKADRKINLTLSFHAPHVFSCSHDFYHLPYHVDWSYFSLCRVLSGLQPGLKQLGLAPHQSRRGFH